MSLRRYLVFGRAEFYPAGGWNDYQGDFESIEEARIVMSDPKNDMAHIVDTETGAIVEEHIATASCSLCGATFPINVWPRHTCKGGQ